MTLRAFALPIAALLLCLTALGGMLAIFVILPAVAAALP